MDSTAALMLAEIPERLLVIGGGYIGLELGQVYAALGSAITLVEMTDGLLPGVDRDLVQPLARQCERQFAAIHLGTRVTALREVDGGLEARVGETAQRFDRVLVAVGRRAHVDGLGLESTRARLRRARLHRGRRALPHRRSAHLRRGRRHRRAHARPPRHAPGQGGGRGHRRQASRLRQRGHPCRRLHRPRGGVVRPHRARRRTARPARARWRSSLGRLRTRGHPRPRRTVSPSSWSIPTPGACWGWASSAREPAS